jgi:hypothetical protein
VDYLIGIKTLNHRHADDRCIPSTREAVERQEGRGLWRAVQKLRGGSEFEAPLFSGLAIFAGSSRDTRKCGDLSFDTLPLKRQANGSFNSEPSRARRHN